MADILYLLGEGSLHYLWLPLVLWSLVCMPLFALSKHLAHEQPIVHYHCCLALLLALPIGFVLMPFIPSDAIEIHNQSGSSQDIASWFISDGNDDYFKYQLQMHVLNSIDQ